MLLSSRLVNVLTPLSLLAMTCSLAGCGLTRSTRTVETNVVQEACKAWAPVSYSSRDTPETQKEARGNNAARLAFGCK